MPVKVYEPTSPGRRFQTALDLGTLSSGMAPKSLREFKGRTGGRNNCGRITAEHRGGGAKRAYRIVDFARRKFGVPATVAAIEYDPNRSAHIALLHYRDGEKAYILCPDGLRVAQTVMAAADAEILPGNALPIKQIPVGTPIHNIALKVGGKGQLVRSAGAAAQVMAKEGGYAQVKLPSGEVRLVHEECWATVGQVGNLDHENVSFGKAGRTRHFGWRPHVRGMAMNPVDHPHGGGEGRSKGGNHPSNRKGLPAKGFKTRQNKRTERFIVKDRRK
ncbi:MAG: 50S ribosomal protein L2 [Deltaproteobacteria bacterium]|nr:50S ribosomal protein L2 [Deltaproteobacteria bacterium]